MARKDFHREQSGWTSTRQSELSKGGRGGRPGDCPCESRGRSCASVLNSFWIPADRTSCSLAVSSVHRYLRRAAAAGISWPLPADWNDAGLEDELFPLPTAIGAIREKPTRTALDFVAMHEQLSQHRYLTCSCSGKSTGSRPTRTVIAARDSASYSKVAVKSGDVVLCRYRKAGEKLLVDWAAARIPVYDREAAQPWAASLFVATLGPSGYTFA